MTGQIRISDVDLSALEQASEAAFAGLPRNRFDETIDTAPAGRGNLAMPPNEPCPHCTQLICDWHNEWYDAAQKRAIYSGQAAMDCPLCRQPVLWFQSRNIAAPPVTAPVPVYQRSVSLAAQWVPIREATCVNLAGYLANHPARQQYSGYWQPGDVQHADQQVVKP